MAIGKMPLRVTVTMLTLATLPPLLGCFLIGCSDLIQILISGLLGLTLAYIIMYVRVLLKFGPHKEFDICLRKKLYNGEKSFRIPEVEWSGIGFYGIRLPPAFRITGIKKFAFENCSGLTSVEIPETVTRIEEGAFWRCSGLTSVEIPYGVTYIGESAFRDCRRLTSVEIPKTVTRIERGAFLYCSGLTSVEIPETVTYIGCAFDYSVEVVYNTSVPMRKMLPYVYVHNGPKLVEVFPYVCEFMDWKELGRMTRVSKWFYSDILVRCRLMFVSKVKAAQKTIVITEDEHHSDGDNDNANDNKEENTINLTLTETFFEFTSTSNDFTNESVEHSSCPTNVSKGNCVRGKEQIRRRDEIEVYSNIQETDAIALHPYIHIDAITSISFPRCYQDDPYVVFP